MGAMFVAGTAFIDITKEPLWLFVGVLVLVHEILPPNTIPPSSLDNVDVILCAVTN